MATELDTLLVKIAADTSSLRGELAKATSAMAKSMQAMAKESEKLNAALDRIGGRIKASIIGALSGISIRGIAKLATDTLEWADNLKSVADRLGVSTDTLQELQFAGRAVNITVAEMTKGIESFWTKFSEAAVGRGRAADILQAMGIDARKITNAEDALTAFSAKIRQFDRQSQLTAAKAFFGDEAGGKFLDLALSNMDEARQKARELGVVIDSSLIAKGEALNKEFEKVTDVGIAKMRQELLGVIMDVQTLVVSVRNLGPEFEGLAESLKNFGPLAGIRELFRARDEARRDAEGQAALNRMGDDRLKTIAGPQVTAGTKRLPAKGGASALEGFQKQIEKLRHEAAALQHELQFDKATAANVKALADFAEAGGKFKPTTEQVRQFSRALKDIEAGKTALAFKEIGDENARLAQIIAAEVSGNRELVAVLEQRFALERALGRHLTEAEAARAAALAKTRFEMEQLRERQRALKQDLESLFDSFAGHAGQALDSILDKSKTVGEAMRDFFIAALRDIANEMFKLAAINPLKNLLFGQNNATIGDVGGLFGNLFGGLGSGGFSGGDILGGAGNFAFFADGGRPPVGVPSIVGERGPELFVPDVAGTIVPNHKMGGSVTYIDARGADQAAIARLEQIVRAQGSDFRRWQAGEPSRVVGHVIDARRGGPRSVAAQLGA